MVTRQRRKSPERKTLGTRKLAPVSNAKTMKHNDDAIILVCRAKLRSTGDVLNVESLVEKAKSPTKSAGLSDDLWLPDLGSNQGPTD